MRARVLAPFTDARTGEDRMPGDVFEVTCERFDEINAAGYGRLVDAVDEEQPKSEPKRPRRQAKPRG